MVDSCFKTQGKAIVKRIRKMGIEKIDLLVLTHSHHDHAGNASRIREEFGCKVLIHREEAEYLAHGRTPPVNGIKPLWKFFMKLLGTRMLSIMRYTACKPDIIIDDDHSLDGYGIKGKIIHTPGHTTGSISIIIDGQYVFVGDTLYGLSRKGVLPPFAQDKEELIRSWGRLLGTEGTRFIPGHGKILERSQVQTEYSSQKG